MYALISYVDGGLIQVNMNGHVFSPMFETEDQAFLFREIHNLACKIEHVSIS